MFVPTLARSIILILALLVVRMLPAQAEIIYDNSDQGTNAPPVLYYPFEYGDQVHLGGTSRILTQIMFEYYGDFNATSGRTARLWIYLNDGPGDVHGFPTPGTVLYSSDSFSLENNYQTKIFSGLDIPVPNTFTWAVEFDGFAWKAGDEAGLLFLDPPTVGSSGSGAWLLENGTTWNSRGFAEGNANFAVRIIGADPTLLTVRLDKKSTNNVQAIVEWPGLSILQRADRAAGPYTDIEGARNRYQTEVGTAPMKFFRLRD